MPSLPRAAFTATGLYFSIFSFGASAILLAALDCCRWKSNLLSLFSWAATYGCAAVFAWFMTGNGYEALLIFGCIFILSLIFYKIAAVASIFGVFFLISMICPTLFGLIWLVELVNIASLSLNAGWLLFSMLVFSAIIFGMLIVCNTALNSWVVLARFSELYFPFKRRKAAWKAAEKAEKTYPWVSIHVPCYSEPPEIVIKTLDAISNLRYPHFEVILLDNNTKDPGMWKPLEEHCRKLGERFRFFHFDQLKGAKAGALNAALRLTAPQAEIIAVFDSDYVTRPDFLEQLIGFFDDPTNGICTIMSRLSRLGKKPLSIRLLL